MSYTMQDVVCHPLKELECEEVCIVFQYCSHTLSPPLQLSIAICSVTEFVGFVSLDAQPHLTGALRVVLHRCDDGDFLDKSNKGNKNAPPSHP